MSDLTKQYPLRHSEVQRELWERAAKIEDRDLANWIRRVLDREAMRVIKEKEAEDNR